MSRGGIKQEKGLVGLQIKDVIKQWKPELKELGFVYQDNVFRYGPTAEEPLKFDIFAQKNVREDTFKVNLAIVVKNPFAEQPDLPVLMGNLRATGVSRLRFRTRHRRIFSSRLRARHLRGGEAERRAAACRLEP